MNRFRYLKRGLGRLWNERSGGIALSFALIAPLLVGMVGGGIDVSNLMAARTNMQNIADGSALAGAKEFRLSNAAIPTIVSVARTYANSLLAPRADTLQNPVVTPTVNMNAKTVTVAIGADVATYFLALFGMSSVHVDTIASARVTGGPPICVIGLDSGANFTVALDKDARIEAPNCSVYSNSTGANGLMAKNNAVVNAGFICSAGGKSGAGPGSFSPTPQTDCPILPDPLASRVSPATGGCLQVGLVISGASQTLQPGTYCGGVTITNGATVTLRPGIYVIKDGPLLVTGNATLTGTNVGFYFTGNGAVLNLDTLSNVALTAPADGDMAGMLMFEDRSSPSGQIHQILSNNAHMLLGTIYLSQNRLHVAAAQPVADQSSYTIVVVRLFTLSAGPTMVLNTNYDSTNIPVPVGVGPNANNTALIQ